MHKYLHYLCKVYTSQTQNVHLACEEYVRRFSQEARTSFQDKKILQSNFLLFAKINLIKLNSLHPLILYQVDIKPLSTQKLNSIKHKQLCSIKTKPKIDTTNYSLNPIS